jgi:hypothetical protein
MTYPAGRGQNALAGGGGALLFLGSHMNDEKMLSLLTQMGAIRGNALVEAADGPDILWRTISRGAGVSGDQSIALRAFILRTFFVRAVADDSSAPEN